MGIVMIENTGGVDTARLNEIGCSFQNPLCNPQARKIGLDPDGMFGRKVVTFRELLQVKQLLLPNTYC